MTDLTKERRDKKSFFSEMFSPRSKYLSLIGLVSFFFLFFLLEFFLLIGLESASNATENFFEIITTTVLWLIYTIIPLVLTLIIFAFTFNKPKAKFISFIFSITGLIGIGIGFGIMAVLYDKVLPSNKYIDLIAFFIILGPSVILSSIFTVITVKKIR